MATDKLQNVWERTQDILTHQIRPMWNAPVEVTLIVRLPGNDEADFLMTTEKDLADLKALLERSEKRAEYVPGRTN